MIFSLIQRLDTNFHRTRQGRPVSVCLRSQNKPWALKNKTVKSQKFSLNKDRASRALVAIIFVLQSLIHMALNPELRRTLRATLFHKWATELICTSEQSIHPFDVYFPGGWIGEVKVITGEMWQNICRGCDQNLASTSMSRVPWEWSEEQGGGEGKRGRVEMG